MPWSVKPAENNLTSIKKGILNISIPRYGWQNRSDGRNNESN